MAELNVGYARVEITPQEPVPMAGYGNTSMRFHERVLDGLWATCLAFTDESGKTALIFTNDLISMRDLLTARTRAAIHAATGIEENAIQLCGTHTHSSVETRNDDEPCIPRYLDYYVEKAVEAAKLALADRKPARFSIARVRIPGLNFVRRYLLNDGDSLTDNYNGNRKADIVAHETTADNEMQLVKIEREGGKTILLSNWQAHCTMTGGFNKHDMSADFPYYFRTVVEEALGVECAYFTGAAGNLNPKSNIPEEDPTKDVALYGKLLAAPVLALTDADFTPIETGSISYKQEIMTLKVNHALDHMVPQAEAIVKLWKETNDRLLCREEGRQYGIHSPYHANSIISRSQSPETDNVELNVVSLGELSFILAPYEMFDTNAAVVKHSTPDKMTLILTCANASKPYIPSAYAFLHAGYENDTCRFEPGTGELLQEEFLAMLRELKK